MSESIATLSQVRYETPAPKIARIVMNRPAQRNAQGVVMTYELDSAFKHACHDSDISVIILAGEGPHFSAGHDLSRTERFMPTIDESIGLWGDYHAPGYEGRYSREREVYFDLTERWRNAPKPTIAEVQGACMMGGNMLAWACDLIIAADDARFRDMATQMGHPGVEFFAHPWELGPRRAKEWLFTGDWLSAEDAWRCGMVNHVVPRAELGKFTLTLAERIAVNDRFALKLAKEAVNATLDAMGRREGMQQAFLLHQIAHLNALWQTGSPMKTSSLPAKLKESFESNKDGHDPS